jgi:hypothetical protein
MEAPRFLTERDCQKLSRTHLLLGGGLLLVMLTVATLVPLMRLGLVAGTSIGLGPTLGEGAGWLWLKKLLRQGERLLNPNVEKNPCRASLVLKQARLLGAAGGWLLGTGVLLFLLRGAGENWPLIVGILLACSLLNGASTFIGLWSLRRDVRKYHELQHQPAVTEPVSAENSAWWTQPETLTERQENRRQ